jgi:nucleotide-binding universal stress UspA family protein
VGLDFTPGTAPVFERALNLARDNHSELLIAHADALPVAMSFMPAANYEEWAAHSRADAKREIDCLLGRGRELGLRCHALVLLGPVDDALINAARKLEVDLIVLGSHGHAGFSRLWSGNVAARVNAHAPCSVLTVRLSRAATEPS